MKKKRVEWSVGLYPYNLSEKRVTVPRVQLRGTVTLEQLAEEMERRTGIYRRDNIRAIVSIMESIIEDFLIDGYAVSGKLGTLTPCVTGIWNDNRLSPKARAQNKAVARYAMSQQLKKSFADPLFTESRRRQTGPNIGSVRNTAADYEQRDHWMPDDDLLISGKALLMNGDDPERGVYFVDAETGESVAHVKPERLWCTRSQMIVRIPDIPAGRYRLRIVSQCTTTKRPLNKPHTGDSSQVWVIGELPAAGEGEPAE